MSTRRSHKQHTDERSTLRKPHAKSERIPIAWRRHDPHTGWPTPSTKNTTANTQQCHRGAGASKYTTQINCSAPTCATSRRHSEHRKTERERMCLEVKRWRVEPTTGCSARAKASSCVARASRSAALTRRSKTVHYAAGHRQHATSYRQCADASAPDQNSSKRSNAQRGALRTIRCDAENLRV